MQSVSAAVIYFNEHLALYLVRHFLTFLLCLLVVHFLSFCLTNCIAWWPLKQPLSFACYVAFVNESFDRSFCPLRNNFLCHLSKTVMRCVVKIENKRPKRKDRRPGQHWIHDALKSEKKCN